MLKLCTVYEISLTSYFYGISEGSITKRNYQCSKLTSSEKRPASYEGGNAATEFASEPEDHHRRIYYKALDLIIESITDCFDQSGYELYSNFMKIMQKSSNL